MYIQFQSAKKMLQHGDRLNIKLNKCNIMLPASNIANLDVKIKSTYDLRVLSRKTCRTFTYYAICDKSKIYMLQRNMYIN